MSLLKFLTLFTSVILFISNSSFALVDYSSGESADVDSGSIGAKASKSHSPILTRKVDAPKLSGETYFNVGTNYESVKVSRTNSNGIAEEGNVDYYYLNAHFDSNFNIYTDLSYWYANSSVSSLTSTTSMQKGNPIFKLGFNWLNVGSTSDKARIDFYGGFSLKETDSQLASSRNDEIVGVMTTKRFNQFVIGIGGELILTGKPNTYGETEIGNISKLSAEIGWVVSSDIRLSLAGQTTRINHADDLADPYTLKKDEKFSTLTPKLFLQVMPSTELELGVTVPTRKLNINDDRVFHIKNISTPGMYGTSLIVGLGFSI